MGVAILPKFHFKYKKSMKKFLLIGALAVSYLANAYGFDVTKFEKVQVRNKAVSSLELTKQTAAESYQLMDIQSLMEARKQQKDASYDLIDEYYALGAFHLGIYEGTGSYKLGLFILPYMDSVVYQNAYGHADWLENGDTVAKAADSYITGYGISSTYYIPEVADHTFNPSKDWGPSYKDTTFQVKGSKYASTANAQYVFSAVPSKFMGGGTENANMTLCAMWADPALDPDDDNPDGNDLWRVGGRLTGDVYLNGTGVHLDSANRSVTADTLGIIVDNRGLMKIEQILWPIYNDGKADAVNKFIPDGAQLRVNIFPIKGNTIYVDDTIASAVMTNADYVSAGTGYEWLGTLHTKFYEEDMWGSLVQTPIWIDGDFYVQLTNFNETGCDFGIFSDFYNSNTATTVYQQDGKFSFRASRGGGGKYGQNLGVSFDAYFPTLISGEESNIMYVPNEGGYAYHSDPDTIGTILYANVHPEDWEFEIEEDWLQVAEVDTAYYAQYRAGIIYLQAEALPDGVTSRSALVNVIADGAVQTFIVYQGVGQGIENTKADAIFDNKNYDVLGREIKDQNFKGVVIRNGQKKLVK